MISIHFVNVPYIPILERRGFTEQVLKILVLLIPQILINPFGDSFG